jgi:hypothetical protein
MTTARKRGFKQTGRKKTSGVSSQDQDGIRATLGRGEQASWLCILKTTDMNRTTHRFDVLAGLAFSCLDAIEGMLVCYYRMVLVHQISLVYSKMA